ncbi:MAG: response regulator [Eubacteriales bacterium]|nr:response regulator [Eubacteriales bacterium]
MLKVLVVDDEKLVRQMILRCIDWTELGLEIVGEASGSEEGLKMAAELHPNIVFTDIRMPVMDGLEFARRITERYPDTKIIILSGHDEFEYASEGIKIGVFDYLLKPIDQEEIRDAAVKVRDAILQEQDYQQSIRRLKQELSANAGYIREKQLAALVRSQKPDSLLDSLEYLDVRLRKDIFQVALVEVLFDNSSGMDEENKLLLKMKCQELMQEYFKKDEHIYVISSGMQSIMILNNQMKEEFFEICDILKEHLIKHTKCGICIGVGEAYTELEQLHISYREAKDALKYRFTAGKNQTISFRDIYPYYDTEINMSEEKIHEFGFSIRSGSLNGTLELLDETFEKMRIMNFSKDETLLFALRFVMEVMTILLELKIHPEDMPKGQSQMIQEIFSLSSLDEIRGYLEQLTREASRMISRELGDKEKDMVRKVTDHLQEHYQEEEISLSSLAKDFYTNSSYLSRVFKEKTGKTFSGYLFELRMGKAMKLFAQSDLKSYEVAERVGIKDPHYFSVCFKKHTGMSVSEYKKSLH